MACGNTVFYHPPHRISDILRVRDQVRERRCRAVLVMSAPPRPELTADHVAALHHLDLQLRDTRHRLTAAVKDSGTTLTAIFGIGPDSGVVTIGDRCRRSWATGCWPVTCRVHDGACCTARSLLGVGGGLELDHELGWDAAAFLDLITLVLGPVAYLG